MFYYKHFKNIDGFKRILTDEELELLFASIDNNMDLLFFKLMLLKGKRISELVKLNIQDIDFKAGLIYTFVSKKRDDNSRRITYLDDSTKFMLLDYCQAHAFDIAYNNGFLFYSETRKRGHKSEKCFTSRFHKHRARIGLNKHFYIDRAGNKRYFIRSHSLRATAINKVLEATDGDIFKTLAFSHHKTIEGLVPYINEYNKKQLNEIENKAFRNFKQQKLTIFLTE